MTELVTDDDIIALKMVHSQLGTIPPEFYDQETISQRQVALKLVGSAISLESEKCYEEAIETVLELFDIQSVVPNKIIGLAAHCAKSLKRKYEVFPLLLEFSDDAMKKGKLSMAMNCIKHIFTFAGGGKDYWIFNNPEGMIYISEVLQGIADQIDKLMPIPRSNSKPRYAIVTVNLVDHIMAYSKTAMQFARYLDSEKYDCYLYFAEETWGEKPQDFSIKFNFPSSYNSGPEFMAELKRLPVSVRTCPPVNALNSAKWLAETLQKDQIDGVIFQAGVNASVQWVASAICDVPVKASLCLGLNMYQTGQHATVYMNQINLEREQDFWRSEWGNQYFISGGADRLEAQQAPALLKEDYNLPEDCITFGTMSNYIERRITSEYLECVSQVLISCPEAYFICMGQGDNSHAKSFMLAEGLSDKCRWLPKQSNCFAALKLLDFYYNEFPVGGSQSIRECIACGVPAMSLEYSKHHHESVGADIVGEEAVLNCDKEAYVQKAISWIKDVKLRNAAKVRLDKRSKELYSAEAFVSQLANLLDELSSIQK